MEGDADLCPVVPAFYQHILARKFHGFTNYVNNSTNSMLCK